MSSMRGRDEGDRFHRAGTFLGVDRSGNVWVALARDGIVVKREGDRWVSYTCALDIDTSTLHSSDWPLREAKEDLDGAVWFGATRFDGQSWKTSTAIDGLLGFPGKLDVDRQGNLWGVARGPRSGLVVKFDGEKWTNHVSTPEPDE